MDGHRASLPGQSLRTPMVPTADEHHADTAVAHGSPASWSALAGKHYENFPVGSFLVPKGARTHLHRIYAFARTADDLADEFADAEGLRWMRREMVRHFAGRGAEPADQAPPVPLFVDLADTVHALALDPQLFHDLLDAFTQDLTVTRYSDEAQLMDYCRRSADPVGRLMLRVFGQQSEPRDLLSDRICTALQLLNHLQDIGEDLRDRDRLYFPMQDLERFGVTVDDLRAPAGSEAVRRLVAYWTDKVAAMFAEGWPLIGEIRGRLRLELRAILAGAAQVLDRIRAADHDVLSHHIRLTKWARVQSLLRGVFRPSMPREFLQQPPGGQVR